MSRLPIFRGAGMSRLPVFRGARMTVRPFIGSFGNLDLFAVGSNAVKLPVGRGHSRPRAADNLEDNT